MSKFKFSDKAAKFRVMVPEILERMANNAVYQFKVVNFDKAAFNGKAWAPRKVADGSRQMLVKTGRLRQSIMILKRESYSITVGSNVPYADYHNNGTTRLPKRQFIGDSAELRAKNKKVLSDAIKKIV